MRHKVQIVVSENDWAAFRSLCAIRRRNVGDELGRLVHREVAAFERQRAKTLGRSKAVQRAYDQALAEIEGSGSS